MIKKYLKIFFKILGYKISKIKNDYKQINFDDIYKKEIKNRNPLIFDVGANRGQSIYRFSNLFPNSIIHAFEPIKSELLKIKKKDNLFLNNFALGEANYERDFFETIQTENSSFYKINKNSKWLEIRSEELQTTQEKFTKNIKKIKIKTLNDYCNSHKISNIYILKIDTQGYEEKVLIGANKILDKIKFIEVEIMLDDVYKKKLSFFDIESILNNKFKLVGLKTHNFNNIYEGYMFVVDALYENLDNRK